MSLADEIAAVSALARDLGLGAVAPTLLSAAHRTTLLIASHGIVAKVQSAGPCDDARRRAADEIALARHLAGRGAPVLAPLGRLAGPHVVASMVVTLWPYLEPDREADERDAALAAATLAAVHRAMRDYRGVLPPYTATLDRCWAVLAGEAASASLGTRDADLLRTHFRRLRGAIEAVAGGFVPLHGDAHPGNLLLARAGPVWLDFEAACLGPPEHDIACLPPSAWGSFGGVDPALIGLCADLKSVCVALWCGIDRARSAAVREAADHHLGRVRAMTG